MLVTAAVCPHPPLLVPRVAGSVAPDLDACRAACQSVIEEVLLEQPDLLVVIGGGAETREHTGDVRGTLVPYGLDLALGAGDGQSTLPLSLGIGRWLLVDRTLPATVYQEVAVDIGPADAAAVGKLLGTRADRTAALVMADGSAYPLQTPVGDDGRGDRYDDQWIGALETANVSALAELDPADDVALWATGRAALQVLAGACQDAGGDWRGRIAWRGSPYGVGYAVASVRRA